MKRFKNITSMLSLLKINVTSRGIVSACGAIFIFVSGAILIQHESRGQIQMWREGGQEDGEEWK